MKKLFGVLLVCLLLSVPPAVTYLLAQQNSILPTCTCPSNFPQIITGITPTPTPVNLLYSQSTAVTVTGTTAATTLINATGAVGSVTLPAGYFSTTGIVLVLRYQGTWNQGGAGVANDAYLISLGGNTISAGQGLTAFPTTASVNHCSMTLIFTATAVGTSGSVVSNGGMTCDTPGTLGAVSPAWIPFGNASNTLNTTSALIFNMTVALNNAGRTVTSTNIVLASWQ